MSAGTQARQQRGDSGMLRSCHIDDVEQIAALLKIYSDQRKLLPRSASDIYRTFREFAVLETDAKIVGCAALQIFSHDLGEVRSLAVDPLYAAQGYGSRLLQLVEQQAIAIGLGRLMALTYVEDFFHQHGYVTVTKETLPEKVWGVCINCPNFLHCDEIAVLKTL